MNYIKVFKRGFLRNRLVAQYPADIYNMVVSIDGVLTIRPSHFKVWVSGNRVSVSVLALSPKEWSYAFQTSCADSLCFNPYK